MVDGVGNISLLHAGRAERKANSPRQCSFYQTRLGATVQSRCGVQVGPIRIGDGERSQAFSSAVIALSPQKNRRSGQKLHGVRARGALRRSLKPPLIWPHRCIGGASPTNSGDCENTQDRPWSHRKRGRASGKKAYHHHHSIPKGEEVFRARKSAPLFRRCCYSHAFGKKSRLQRDTEGSSFEKGVQVSRKRPGLCAGARHGPLVQRPRGTQSVSKRNMHLNGKNLARSTARPLADPLRSLSARLPRSLSLFRTAVLFSLPPLLFLVSSRSIPRNISERKGPRSSAVLVLRRVLAFGEEVASSACERLATLPPPLIAARASSAIWVALF